MRAPADQARRRWYAIAALLVAWGSFAGGAGGAGCSSCQREAPPHAGVAAAPEAKDDLPAWYPASLDPARYAGSAACADCHRALYDAWRASPHGRAMALPGRDTVLGDFSGTPVAIEGAVVTPLRRGDRYLMRIESGGRTEEHRVELVLGSGRQHQVYLTRGADGGIRQLPLYYATRARRWADIVMHRGVSMDPASPRYWLRPDLESEGNCIHCHLSQGRARADGTTIEEAWVELPVNCEACHGAARAHVEARRSGRPGEALADLRAIDRVDEARRCGACHASQHPFHEDGSLPFIPVTLATNLFRADGTQLGAGYQYAGHVTSGCFNRGAATCSGCHDPHRQTARSFDGEPATGERADRQCTVCHRDRIDPAAARSHSHHAAAVRCIDCHMPRHTLFDDRAANQEVSDHAISIPRPRERLELGLPDACGGCHDDRPAEWSLAALERWGQSRATGVRPWVRAIWLGRRRDPGAVEALLATIAAKETPAFVRLSALNLLGRFPPDPRVVPALAPLAEDRDAAIRGAALHMLAAHDPARRDGWIAGLIGDPDPLVRVLTLAFSGRTPLDDAQLALLTRDVTRLSTVPPGDALAVVAELAAAGGREATALRLLDAALRHATPLQIENRQMRALRERLQRALPPGVAP